MHDKVKNALTSQYIEKQILTEPEALQACITLRSGGLNMMLVRRTKKSTIQDQAAPFSFQSA